MNQPVVLVPKFINLISFKSQFLYTADVQCLPIGEVIKPMLPQSGEGLCKLLGLWLVLSTFLNTIVLSRPLPS